MNKQNLRNLLEKADNKLSIFASVKILKECNYTANDFLNAINDFLTDDEKLKLFDYPHFQKFTPSIKSKIIALISDSSIKLEILRNTNLMNSFQNLANCGLDNTLMRINPEHFTQDQRNTLIQLCDIYPNLQIINTLNNSDPEEFVSTASEYKKAEEWINSIIESFNPQYLLAQKIALIDHALGKKISYSPDFDTEICDDKACRALWKIISSGYGVCNGIARAEQYILERIDVKSEIVSSDSHTFLKLINIVLPLATGKLVKGNTILDPTWNLANHRFDGKPDNFCISYENARKNDIDAEGKDHNCHKNDKKLQDATLHLDEISLKCLFRSVNLTDKDGYFPIKNLIELSEMIDDIFANLPEQNIHNQFLLLSKVCPEFATCQNSTMRILSDVLLNNINLKFNRCVINRVYDKSDKEKKPVLFVYIDSTELGKRFYFADKNEGQFIKLSPEEFVNQFECYEEDLKKQKRT